MERRTQSASKVVLTFAIIAHLSAITVYAIVCDPHCAVKSGCVKRGPGRCDRLCVPITLYRLNSDYKCVPRCGGNCLYCGSYMRCDGCRFGYKPVGTDTSTTAICKAGGCDIHCVSDCHYWGTCYSACVSGYYVDPSTLTCKPGTVAPTTSLPGTGSTVPITIGTGSTIAQSVVSTVPVTIVPTTVAPTTPLVCDPHCDPLTNGCTLNGGGKCDNACVIDYYLNNATHTCGACDQFCNAPAPSCTSAGTCAGPCDSGYAVFSSTGMCAACSTGCTNCTSPGTCANGSCSNTTVYDSATSACLGCDPECVSGCVTASFCDANPSAIKCLPAYGFTATKKCGPCDSACNQTISCDTSGAGYCDGNCQQGYIIDPTTKTCAECQKPNPTYCGSCTVAGYCDSCFNSTFTLLNGYCS
jgi:hypothetical protein